MRFAILTSDQRRHDHAARVLAAKLPVGLVVREVKEHDPSAASGDDPGRALVREHFTKRDQTEARMLVGAPPLPESTAVLDLPPKGLQSAEILPRLRRERIDACIVFGTSIIREPLLSGIPLLNIHLGVSPYYRGSATNFWAMARGDLHLVGATIHEVSAKVDAGPIVAHALPPVHAGDTMHELGTRALLTGLDTVGDVAVDWANGRLPAVPQWTVDSAVLCRRADFTPERLKLALERWDAGLVAQFLREEARLRGGIRYIVPPSGANHYPEGRAGQNGGST